MAKLDFPAIGYDKFGRTGDMLSCFASDVCCIDQRLCHRLYNDACDVGIAIQGRTRQIFALEEEEVRDGDLLASHFVPVDPRCPIKRVTIFND